MRILIVEDESSLREQLARGLRGRGYIVDAVSDGNEGLYYATQYPVDLAVVDLGLPGMSGMDVIKRLREEGKTFPVLILTARSQWQDKVEGLAIGGDDYMTKPFSLEELVARLRALLRRIGVVEQSVDDEKIRFADLELDEATHEVRRAGVLLELSPTEFTLLRYLLINADRVVSKAQILDHVWDYDFGGDAGIVETYISYLRKKIDIYEPALIHTVRGVGYRLRLPAAK